jgi:proteasome lid subunit RPN8/RPN11
MRDRDIKMGRETLQFILEVSKESYPDEFAGVLRQRDGIISEVLFLPGHFGDRSALMHLHMLPIDLSVVGTVHSHPSSSPEPSSQDLVLFSSFGKLHIITYYPFEDDCWVCYTRRGEPIPVEVVDDPEEGEWEL